MQKLFVSALAFLGMSTLYAVKPPEPAVAPAPPSPQEIRKKDSVTYVNLTTDQGLYQWQTDTNTILLYNNIKLHFNKMTRMNMPRGATFNNPDPSLQRTSYDLVELEITGTNTGSSDLKFDAEPVMVSLKMFSPENYKAYPSQANVSNGSYYLLVEPQQMEKMNTIYLESNEFLNHTWKAGQTKTFRGMVVALPRNVKKIDKIVVYTREFGQNKSYGCPAKF